MVGKATQTDQWNKIHDFEIDTLRETSFML